MRKAYSLVEAVLAVSILTIIISVGVSIIFVSSDTENTNKDLLIGSTLAAEGAEAMKGIYYTNILKYGEDGTDCGLVLPEQPGEDAEAECVEDYFFYGASDRFYKLSRKYETDGSPNDLLTWELNYDPATDTVSIADDGALGVDDSEYKLNVRYVCDGEVVTCDEEESIGQIYAHDGTDETKFYREILTRDNGANVLVSSRVHWITSVGSIRTVDSSFELPKSL